MISDRGTSNTASCSIRNRVLRSATGKNYWAWRGLPTRRSAAQLRVRFHSAVSTGLDESRRYAPPHLLPRFQPSPPHESAGEEPKKGGRWAGMLLLADATDRDQRRAVSGT
jgi:hypothetical protein